MGRVFRVRALATRAARSVASPAMTPARSAPMDSAVFSSPTKASASTLLRSRDGASSPQRNAASSTCRSTRATARASASTVAKPFTRAGHTTSRIRRVHDENATVRGSLESERFVLADVGCVDDEVADADVVRQRLAHLERVERVEDLIGVVGADGDRGVQIAGLDCLDRVLQAAVGDDDDRMVLAVSDLVALALERLNRGDAFDIRLAEHGVELSPQGPDAGL